jgi:antitoxin component of RelBE/YafQ-DinJ toxin-antitoxin module
VLVSPNALTAETLRNAEAGRKVREFETAEELFEDLES